jgi:hypothetical protein
LSVAIAVAVAFAIAVAVAVAVAVAINVGFGCDWFPRSYVHFGIGLCLCEHSFFFSLSLCIVRADQLACCSVGVSALVVCS